MLRYVCLRQIKERVDLQSGYGWEIREELVDGVPLPEMIKQRRDWDTCTAETGQSPLNLGVNCDDLHDPKHKRFINVGQVWNSHGSAISARSRSLPHLESTLAGGFLATLHHFH